MSDSLWDEAANRFRSVASKVVTTGLGDRKKTPTPAPAPQTAPLQKSFAAERVQMAEAGGPIVAADQALKSAASRFASDADALRTFVIGVGTARTGRFDVAAMRAALQREDAASNGAAHAARVVAGFDAGVAAAKGGGLTQSALAQAPSSQIASSGPTILGFPQSTVVVAGGVVAAAGLATYLLKPAWLGIHASGDRSRRRGRSYSRRYAYARRW